MWGFQIGEIVVTVEGDGPRGVLPPFEPVDAPTLRLRAVPSDEDLRPRGRALVDADGYGVFVDGERVSFVLKSDRYGTPEFARVDLDGDGARGELHFRSTLDVNPLHWKPLDELIVLDALSRRGGLLLHAAAAARDSSGLLLVGVSGAGKSTISRALHENEWTVLTDERAVARPRSDGKWVVDGTPWPGDGLYLARGSAPLRAVVLLEKSDDDRLLALSPARAMAQLYRCHFAPFWNPAAEQASLDALERLVREVPCWTLKNRLNGDGPRLLLDLLK